MKKMISVISLALLAGLQVHADDCKQNILLVPQLHIQSVVLGKSNAGDLDIIENQIDIYNFLGGQNKVIPIFEERIGENFTSNDGGEKIRNLFSDFKLPTTLSSLKKTQRDSLAKFGATLALVASGNRDMVYSTSPSHDEHIALNHQINEMWDKGDIKTTDPVFEKAILLRDQWALIEVLKWFKKNPTIPYAFLVYGASHNFPGYIPFLPKSVCISHVDIFESANKLRKNYDVGSAPLLNKYIETEFNK